MLIKWNWIVLNFLVNVYFDVFIYLGLIYVFVVRIEMVYLILKVFVYDILFIILD